jgi:3-hydroxyacyl-CoA dehydrogenase/enoyl-CoA hydratase/3-hydroxybutyryl-CoA epimerase
MQCVYEGLQLPMDQALRVEQRWFAKILRSDEAKAMMRSIFVSMQELNKGARRPPAVPPVKIRTLGILGGGGFMGAGIGYVSAQAGIRVILIDRDQASADKGLAHADKLVSGAVEKGRATAAEREALLAHISATADYAALKDCDLVIEAVFEDRKVKAETYAMAQPHLKPGAVFASNTSTLPITSLAADFTDQARFIGIHFFSPVDRMMLVEVIVGKHTGDIALATALDYVRAIRKTPIVVNDARGFYANRCVLNYVGEGLLMVAEGVPPAMIENVGKMAGMPVGPLSLIDEVALDLGLKIMKATETDLGAQAVDQTQKALLVEMVEKRGRLGRKNGKGFYEYPEKGHKRLWPELGALQGVKLDPDKLDVTEMKQRLLAIQAVEAARTVEDHVIVDPREADVGSILGFGFAPFTGGTLSYIDTMGARAFVDMCQRLEKKYGPRFKPPALLLDMADKSETFYGRFLPAKVA